MKKIITALALVGVTGLAHAGQATLSVANDDQVDRVGSRVTLAADKPLFGSVVPFVSGTFNERYVRLAAGGEVGLFNVGPVRVAANLAAVHQRNETAPSLGGVTAGVRATLPVTKTVSVVAGVERFDGNGSSNQYNGVVTTVGLSTRF